MSEAALNLPADKFIQKSHGLNLIFILFGVSVNNGTPARPCGGGGIAQKVSPLPPRYGADVDVNHHLASRVSSLSLRPLTTLVVCPLYISAAYHNLQCFRLLLQAGANPDFNCCGPINIQGFSRGSPVCVMDAVLRHGCDAAFIHLLIDFGANLNLVKVEALEFDSTGRVKVNPEALQVFKEARGK